MAIELRNHIQQVWGITIPINQFFEGMSVTALTEMLLTQNVSDQRSHVHEEVEEEWIRI